MPLITGLDIETTGLHAEKGDRIIEINMQVFDLATRKRRVNWTQRIHPGGRTINAAAQAVHHISLADLAGKPLWEDGPAKKVHGVLQKSALLVAHNGNSFDLPFIAEELETAGLEIPDVTPFDTMLEGRWATTNGKVPSLQELAWACDEEYDTEKAHAADYDVSVMMDCFWKGLDWGFFALPEKLQSFLTLSKEAA